MADKRFLDEEGLRQYTALLLDFVAKRAISENELSSLGKTKDCSITSRVGHVEGNNSQVSGESGHAEGSKTKASQFAAHAEGHQTTASGSSSHAEGEDTVASGINSHAEGEGTVAQGDKQHVQGKWNIPDSSLAEIVGGGGSNSTRRNIATLDWDGNQWYQGKVSVGTPERPTQPTALNDLVTKKYVDDADNQINATISSKDQAVRTDMKKYTDTREEAINQKISQKETEIKLFCNKKILKGKGAPSSSLGENDDIYIELQ